MFIDKTLIIVFTNIRPIYIKRKEGGKRLDAGETERECVCERRSVAENGGSVGCKNGRGETDYFVIC
jgi:hypothetical protein